MFNNPDFITSCGMAALLAGFQSDGLEHPVCFGGKDLRKAPQKFGGVEVFIAWEPIVTGRIAWRGRKFSKAFWCSAETRKETASKPAECVIVKTVVYCFLLIKLVFVEKCNKNC